MQTRNTAKSQNMSNGFSSTSPITSQKYASLVFN